MKKLLKVFLILVAIVVVLLIIGVVVITRPGFQKSIFLSAMEGKADKVQVETLSAGFSTINIQALDLEKDGAIVKIGDLSVKYHPFDYLFSKELNIDELILTGLYVDTRNMKSTGQPKDEKSKPSGEGGVPEFGGVFENAEIPVKLNIGKVQVQGEVLLPNRELTFDVTGGDIAPGKEGSIQLTGELKDQTPGAAAGVLSVNGALKLNQTTAQKLDRIAFDGDVSASGGSLSQPAKLTIAAVAAQQGDTEQYTVQLSVDGQPIASLDSTFTPASESLVGGLTANVDRAALAPFLMGADLPDFTLSADEKFTLDGKTEQFDVAGTLQLDLRNLAQWKPELADVGGGTLTANLKSTMQPGRVLLETMDANFDTTNGRKLLALELKRQFEVKIVDGKPQLDGQPGDLLSIQLTNLPVAWLSPFTGGTKLSGGDITAGALLSGTSAEALSVKSTQPWQIDNLSASKDGKALLRAVNLQLTPEINVNGQQLTADFGNVSMTSAGKTLLKGALGVTVNDTKNAADTTSVTLNVQGDLAKLQAQPMLEPYAGLAGGSYQIGATAKPAGSGLDVDANLTLTDLTTKNDFVNLPSATLALKGNVDGAEKVDLQGPLALKGVAHTSQAQLTLNYSKADAVKKFNVDLNGPLLVINQLQFLQRAFKNPENAPPPPPPGEPKTKPTGPDKVAVWSGNDGVVNISFQTVIMSKSTFKDFTGKLVINEETLSLTPLKANLNGSPVEAKAVINFRAGAPKPYLLDASLDLEGLEVGAFTSKDGNPQNAGITGVYTFKGTAGGESPTLGQFSELAQFDLSLKGVNGVVRTDGGPVGSVVAGIGGGIGLVSELTSMAGIDMVKDNPAIQQINGLLQSISKEIKYDEISVKATRKEDLNIHLSDFLLVSSNNNMKWKGNGKITYREGVAITQQPMDISARLWTKGEQLTLINKFKLAGSEKDSDGFQSGPGFDITGTLTKPNYYSSLEKTLFGNAANMATNLVGGALNNVEQRLIGGGGNKQGEQSPSGQTQDQEK